MVLFFGGRALERAPETDIYFLFERLKQRSTEN